MAADAVFAVQALCKNDEKEGTHGAMVALDFYSKLVIASPPCSLDLRNRYGRNFIDGAEGHQCLQLSSNTKRSWLTNRLIMRSRCELF